MKINSPLPLDISHITATWALFFGTWSIVYYTQDFGIFDKGNFDAAEKADRAGNICAILAMIFLLIKINVDYFLHFCSSSHTVSVIISAILSFFAFSSFCVFMGVAADRNSDNTDTHTYAFGWISVILLLVTFVMSFLKDFEGLTF